MLFYFPLRFRVNRPLVADLKPSTFKHSLDIVGCVAINA
jgi:hypothetical protein